MNDQQIEASNQILKMLLSDDRGFCLVGGAGTGKSFTLRHVLARGLKLADSYFSRHNINRNWSVQLTGPTHKSVDVLQDIYSTFEYNVNHLSTPCTIYSYLNLKPIHEQGETKLVKRDIFSANFTEENPHLLVIDEASMLPQIVLNYLFEIMESNPGIKVLFIFDHLQLSPPKSNSIPIHTYSIPTYELTQFMRSHDKNIENIGSYLRDVVKNGDTPNLDSVLTSKADFINTLESCIRHDIESTVIVTYTNKASNTWNDYVYNYISQNSVDRSYNLSARLLGESFEYYKNNNAHVIPSDSLVYLGSNKIFYKGSSIDCSIVHPDDRANELKLLASDAKKTKNWKEYYAYKNSTPDLRLPFARTAYKVQGDTFDNVFVDLKDIMSCNIKDIRNRLLYVACSRARKGLYILGE